ncbi:MAG: diguanylate cyclase [Rhodocyclaceae bacterium]|nr:diguanylate cyclase [Rhodocyclaceae bacterium]
MNNVRATKRAPGPSSARTVALPILVVEDQHSIAQLLAAMIKERWNAEVCVAHSLREARELVQSHPAGFLVATCDLHLPDAPYGEVLDFLNAAGIKTIALSGAYGEDFRDTVLNKGAIDFVPKDNINSFEYVTELVGRISKNRHLKVLVADDSMSARAVLKHTLEQLCFQVLTANDGKEALAALAGNPDIRLLLADYNMPEMDGFALTIEARKKFGKDRLAIIGISSSDDETISARFIKCGANDFIRRPYSYEEFVCRINQNVDMLELIQANRDAAYRDFLTGLFNRRYFFLTGSKLHDAARKSGRLVLAMIDIDHFKKINDEHGHPCGDAALRHLGAALVEHFPQALVARLGGEEFAVLLDDADADEARAQLESFRQSLRRTPLADGGKIIEMAVSIGLADQPGADLDEMIKRADTRLYQAKENGRDRIVG